KTFYPLSPADLTKERIPVGTPMKGCRVVILNEEQKVCDPLMAGEIFIRTPYMTHGYHNDEAMTKEKFITNPLSGNPQDIVFRTGDLGRLLADGNIEFLGRKDRQVKIRGIRVELEEIESALTAQPEVGSAAVMFREVSTDNRVVCAYILDGGGETPVDEHSVRTFAEKTLPDYMIPANIIIMDEFPRKPNGKVDYDSLPSPFDRDRTEYVAPQTPAHEKLMAIWQLVLGEGEYGIRDGFFQAGGNSLNVLTVSSLIHKEFQVKISMTDFFENDTIESLAKLVESMETDVYAAIEPAPEKSFYQVSSVQRRLFFLQQLDPENKSYNMPRIMMLEGDYDVSHLESTLTALIDRHESLRTSFRVEGDLPVQVVHAPGSVVFKGERKTLEMGEEVDLPTVHALVEEFIRPFDLTVAPLMRVAFVTVDAGRLIVMMDTHHIISDGVSQGVFISDFLALYKGKELEPLRIQYKDFSAWQNSEDQQERMARQENYWLKRYSEEVPLLQLPVDLERPNAQTFQGDAIHNAIAKEQLDSIHALALEEGATLYFVLLTLYNTLLGRLAGQEDVIVGSSLAGRRHSDLMGIIGMFVNALALRNYPAGEKTFRQFLVEVRDNTINDFDNQDYQFESLVEKAGIKRVPGRNPAFDVMMVLNNEDAPPVEIPDVKLSFLEFKKTSAQMDLKLRMLETPEGLGCLWEYSTSLFKKETMEMFASNFLKIVTQVLANPDIKLKDIQLTHGLQKSKVDTSMMDFDF
ncbi:MAG: AMP-binding protein, partial [bacterium]|nr:AMP-binding protein [bacterium]